MKENEWIDGWYGVKDGKAFLVRSAGDAMRKGIRCSIAVKVRVEGRKIVVRRPSGELVQEFTALEDLSRLDPHDLAEMPDLIDEDF